MAIIIRGRFAYAVSLLPLQLGAVLVLYYRKHTTPGFTFFQIGTKVVVSELPYLGHPKVFISVEHDFGLVLL